jgi:hypothetical protein
MIFPYEHISKILVPRSVLLLAIELEENVKNSGFISIHFYRFPWILAK